MENLKSKDWWKAAGIRALKTICQTAAATMTGCVCFHDVNWIFLISSSLLAGAYSIVTSIAGLPEVTKKENEEGGDK